MFNRFFRRILLVCILGAGLSGPAPAKAAQVIDVSSVRLGLHADKTRFVMELSEKPTFDIFLLANPYRIVIDLPQVNWQADDDTERKKGVVENYRFGLFKKDTSRVVLDVDGPVKILQTTVLPPTSGKPWRFFIDIQRTDFGSFMTALAERRQEKVENNVVLTAPPVQPPESKKFTVIIDAGHGGIDPGAIGKSGVYEKKITLAVAQKLYAVLKKNNQYMF